MSKTPIEKEAISLFKEIQDLTDSVTRIKETNPEKEIKDPEDFRAIGALFTLVKEGEISNPTRTKLDTVLKYRSMVHNWVGANGVHLKPKPKEATVEPMTLVEVWGNSDSMEGKGNPVLLGTFKNSQFDEAKEFAKNKGVWGSVADVRPKSYDVVELADGRMFKLGDRVLFEDSEEDLKEVREATLAQLTDKQKKALGLK